MTGIGGMPVELDIGSDSEYNTYNGRFQNQNEKGSEIHPFDKIQQIASGRGHMLARSSIKSQRFMANSSMLGNQIYPDNISVRNQSIM